MASRVILCLLLGHQILQKSGYKTYFYNQNLNDWTNKHAYLVIRVTFEPHLQRLNTTSILHRTSISPPRFLEDFLRVPNFGID